MVRAPAYAAERTKFEAGDTVPDVPTATNRSHSRNDLFASHSGFAAMGSSKSTMSGRMVAPQLEQADATPEWDAASRTGSVEHAGLEQRTRNNEP